MTFLETFPCDQQQFEDSTQGITLANKVRLEALWRSINARQKQGKPADKLLARFDEQLQSARDLYQRRLAAKPAQIEFPANLPVAERCEEILKTLKQHQVVILAGETGSGKTTQLPKICLELGRGISGTIGHTQPRRIAASSVAQRIADELHSPLGQCVGFQVRFSDQSQDASLIKVMTDGILLAEIQNDPLLLKYDTIIIDEAHERSLNIDFLLGYLKKILPKRGDLKIIVTSATIDLQRFSKHFDNAPIIEVSGRTYPVEILYRPPENDEEDLAQAIVNTVQELPANPSGAARDILVFLSGEREIRDVAHALRKAQISNLEVLPLYARLSIAEQRRVFAAHRGRRIVLATNVAETSITVPGIGYVIDPGTARISRYSVRTKVQRLPIEPISQASANQRAGRCGRISNGICVRLYEEDDFLTRPEFTDPEIQRTNLASVVLQMLHLGIGDIRRFPFVDMPDKRFISDAYKLLEELQAVGGQGRLTALGKQLAAMPIDPKLARMLIAGSKNAALREVLVVTAALAIQDPRERPSEKQQAADEKHRRFKDDESDFISLLNLWQYVEEQRQELSQNQWRKQCAKEFLSFMRLREWRELHHQLRLSCKKLGLTENKEPAAPAAVHQSLLTGLLSYIGCKNEEASELPYAGARNSRFAIFPGSYLAKAKPKWVMAAELIETSRLFAHYVASIDVQWALAASEHLQKHHYHEPHYVAKTGQVMGYDRITLYGLILAEKKRVNYAHIDSALAREVFIRSALVEGRYALNPRAKGQFFKHNQQVIKQVELLEAKSRRRDILVDDEVLYQFYAERIGPKVTNLAGFEHWRKEAEKAQADILQFNPEMLMQHSAAHISEAQFPNELAIDGLSLPLYYHFEPGKEDDGVSIGIPAGILHSVSAARLEWLVPGLLRDKCIALVKGLPKQWRKLFVPVPHFVDQALARMSPGSQSLHESLQQQLQRLLGRPLPDDLWQDVQLDDFYLMNIKVVDEHNKVIDQSRDLSALRERYRGHVQSTLKNAGEDLERSGLTHWDFGELPVSCQLEQGRGIKVQAYPALVLEQESIALRMLDNPLEAQQRSRLGAVYLIRRQLLQTIKYLSKGLLKNKDIGLSMVEMGSRDAVINDIINAAVAHGAGLRESLPRDQAQFTACVEAVKKDMVGTAQRIENLLVESLSKVVAIKKQLKQLKNNIALIYTISDVQTQLQGLFYPQALYETGLDWLEQYPKYLKGINLRLEKAPLDARKDKQLMESVAPFWQLHQDRLQAQGEAAFQENTNWFEYRWMIEEYRISLFAQTLKTRMPVSDKRLKKAWQSSLD